MPDIYSRRCFLKLSAALAAGGAAIAAAVPGTAPGMGGRVLREAGPITSVQGYCPFCQTRCTYQGLVRDGVLESIVGEEKNRWTGGSMCPKGMSVVELVRSPYRLTEPMLRQADGSWKRISYPEAVSLTASTMKECLDKHGDKAGDRMGLTMPLWDCRESELAAVMLLRLAGCVHTMPPGETCVSTASNMLTLMVGISSGTTTVDELANARTVLLWGANISELYPPYTRWLDKAKQNGAKILYVDPRQTRTSIWSDLQVRSLPGTDGALAMGAIRHILAMGLCNEARARHFIPELDLLAEDVASYDTAKVSSLCQVPADELETFYRAVAASDRTVLWLGGSLSRYTNGVPSVRAILLLQGLTDNLVGSGRGVLTMQSGKPGGEEEFVDHLFGPLDKPKMNFRRLRMAMEKDRMDILFLNSSYRRYPDAKGVLAAIRKVPFVVHMGFFLTEETEAATLFVPATFSPESQGSGYGNEKQVVWRDKMVEAPGSCVPSWRFYRDVGLELFGDKYPGFRDPEDLYRRFTNVVPSWKGMGLDRLRASPDGLVWPIEEVNGAERTGCVFRGDRLLTPDGTMPVKTSVFGRIGWDFPKGSPLGKDRDEKYPLILAQGKVLWHWQQTMTNFSEGMAQFSSGRYAAIHPDTARQFQVAQGDKVLIKTFVGSLEAWVDIQEAVRPGMIFTPSHFSATTPLTANRGEHINTILPNYWDRISCQHNGVGCTLEKISA